MSFFSFFTLLTNTTLKKTKQTINNLKTKTYSYNKAKNKLDKFDFKKIGLEKTEIYYLPFVSNLVVSLRTFMMNFSGKLQI